MSRREVAVVVATRDRPARLAALLDGLRAQTLAGDRFEVIIVDDASAGPETGELLERERARGQLALRVIARASNGGPAAARNDGWRATQAPLVAFTDDDCVPDRRWLEAALDVAQRLPDAVIAGATRPHPAELDRIGPFTHTVDVPATLPWFQTCNVIYRRTAIERAGGFDETMRVGEDTDLARRVIAAGARPAAAPEAIVYHAVLELGPLGKLRNATRWSGIPLVFARYPELRAHLHRRYFWSHSHEMLLGALVALLLPRKPQALGVVRRLALARYAHYLMARARAERTTPVAAPYIVVHDLVEMATIVRGAVRYRLPMV